MANKRFIFYLVLFCTLPALGQSSEPVCNTDSTQTQAKSILDKISQGLSKQSQDECFKIAHDKPSEMKCACENIKVLSQIKDQKFRSDHQTEIDQITKSFKSFTDLTPQQEEKLVAGLEKSFEKAKRRCDGAITMTPQRVGLPAIDAALGFFCSKDNVLPRVLKQKMFPCSGEHAYQAANEKLQKLSMAIKKYTGDSGIEKQLVCQQELSVGAYALTEQKLQPCVFQLGTGYKDNDCENPNLLQSITKDACYQRMVANGNKIQKISIETSSSKMANSGRSDGWNSLKLSTCRADKAEKQIRTIFPDVKQITKNPKGEYGDGSSGPCPYQYVESPKSEIKDLLNDPRSSLTADQKKQLKDGLEAGKYVNISVQFSSVTKPLEGEGLAWTARCLAVKFKCSSDPNLEFISALIK